MNTNPKFRIAIFASGSGTNAEAIMKHFQHHPEIAVVGVLTNNPQAMVLQRAQRFQVATKVFDKTEFKVTGSVLTWLHERDVTHIVLAGFLWLVPDNLLKAYPDRIINIHPSLLPSHGGKGMYGEKVHAAVKASGESETGITVHLVNERFDEGRILFQTAVKVAATDTIEQIAGKVHELEHKWFPTIIGQWILGTLA